MANFIFLTKNDAEGPTRYFAIDPEKVVTLNTSDTFDRYGQRIDHYTAGDYHFDNSSCSAIRDCNDALVNAGLLMNADQIQWDLTDLDSVRVYDIYGANIDCNKSDPSAEEARAWRKGELTIGIFEYDSCPFCVIRNAVGSLDASINVLKIRDEDQREKWLNTPGNQVNLFLIDSRTNILKAMRTVGVSFSEDLRDILEKQIEQYEDAASAERRIAEIQHTVSTDEMFARAKFKDKFNER